MGSFEELSPDSQAELASFLVISEIAAMSACSCLYHENISRFGNTLVGTATREIRALSLKLESILQRQETWPDAEAATCRDLITRVGNAMSLEFSQHEPWQGRRVQVTRLRNAVRSRMRSAERGATYNQRLREARRITVASATDDYDDLELVLKLGSDVDACVRFEGFHGSALAHASRWGHLRCVRLLIYWGADPSAMTSPTLSASYSAGQVG